MDPDAPSLDLLRLVFSFHVVDQIVHADAHVDALEIDWVRNMFPFETLDEHGLIGEDHRLTPHYRQLLSDALIRLPNELSEDEKVALTLTFFDTAMSDGDFDASEGDILHAAANLLGLPMAVVHEALDARDSVGAVDLGDPEVD
jgi:uncharacterized tellurite resistance protein B-like protein